MSELHTVPRFRTIRQCLQALRDLDSDSCISEWSIRELAKNGKIICINSGAKNYINIDSLFAYLNRSLDEVNDENKNKEINHGTTD